MADKLTPAQRSALMARIGGKNTQPELKLRRALHAMGLRYRLHAKELPGRPDLVFPRHATVVFIDGCFWHGHAGCRQASRPSTRKRYWNDKIDGNIRRDARNKRALRRLGWRVLTVWECAIDTKPKLARVAERIARKIRHAAARPSGRANR